MYLTILFLFAHIGNSTLSRHELEDRIDKVQECRYVYAPGKVTTEPTLHTELPELEPLQLISMAKETLKDFRAEEEGDWSKRQAFVQIASVQARLGELAAAEKTIDELSKFAPDIVTTARSNVLAELALAGKIDSIPDVDNKTLKESEKVSIIASIVLDKYAKYGIEGAKEYLLGIKEEETLFVATCVMAANLHRIGKAKEALRILKESKTVSRELKELSADYGIYGENFFDVIALNNQLGEFAKKYRSGIDPREIYGWISFEEVLPNMAAAIAGSKAVAGDHEGVKRFLVASKFMLDANPRLALWLVEGFLYAGDLSDALKIVQMMPSNELAPQTWLSVSLAQAQSGDWQGAIKSRSKIGEKGELAIASASIAAALGKAGKIVESREELEPALDAVGTASKPGLKSRLLAEIAMAQWFQGEQEKALATLKDAEKSYNSDEAFNYDPMLGIPAIIAVYVAIGKPTRAMDHILEYHWSDRSIWLIEEYLKANDRPGALSTIISASTKAAEKGLNQDIRYLGELMRYGTRLGGYEQMYAFAKVVSEPSAKAFALVGIAEGLIDVRKARESQ